MTALGCPSAATLSAFADHELTADEASAVQAHLDGCGACREELLDWLAVEDGLADAVAECLSPETLVAFTQNLLTAEERVRTTAHLATCLHCRRETEAMAPTTARAAVPSLTWRDRVAAAATAFAHALVRPGPVLSAVTATVLVIIALARLLPREDLQQLSLMKHPADVASSSSSGDATSARRLRNYAPPAPAAPAMDLHSQPAAAAPEPSTMKRELGAASGSPPDTEARKQKEDVRRDSERDALAKVAPPAAGPPNTAGRLPSTNGFAPRWRADGAQLSNEELSRSAELKDQAAAGGLASPSASRGEAGATPPVLSGHAEPSPDSTVIVTVRPDELLARIRDEHGWTLVALSNQKTAWFLSTDVPANVPPIDQRDSRTLDQ